MKFLPDDLIAKLSQQFASEPFIVVSIHWGSVFSIDNYTNTPNLNESQLETILNYGNTNNLFGFYGDKDIYDDSGNLLVQGKLLSISPINSDVNFEQNSQTSQVTVTLDDSDNSLLDILKTSPIHKRPAFVYIGFVGVPLSKMIRIFEGEIVSDFRWTEKEKTVTFNFLTRVEEKEVGFSPEQGYIQDLPIEMIGRPWPFGFGSIIKYPAIRINYTPTAVTTEPIGLHDYSLDTELSRLTTLKEYFQGVAETYAKAALEAIFTAQEDDPGAPTGSHDNAGDQFTELANQALAIVQQVLTDKNNLETILTEQILYQNGLDTQGGTSGKVQCISDVPVKLNGLFELGDLVIRGHMTASNGRTSTLTIDKIVHPIPGTTTWGNNYFPPQKESFIFVNAGTAVKFLGKYPLRYLVNTLGGTVEGVYAYRQFEGLKRLAPVPKKYWNTIAVKTVPPGVVTTVPTFRALVIELTQPLSTLRNEFWDDDLYVSYKSSIGPNSIDILKFLIGMYTHYSIDINSFNKTPAYNCNFVLPDQKDVMQVIKEICFQCKYGIWIQQGKFFIIDMSNFYDDRMLLDLSHIIQDSVEISISPTESIITKMRGSWRYNYEYDTRNYVAIRYNDNIYGVHPLDTDYYCFNDPSQVMSSMVFWIYRKGNVWKRMKLSLPLEYIQLDVFDNIALTPAVCSKYSLGDLKSQGEILHASIIGISLDPETFTVQLELELPIYVGAKKQSPAYWINSYGGFLWQIDENYQLTETPKQSAYYQRGFSISQAIAGAKLQAEYFKALETNTGTVNGLPSPNSVNGDPEPRGVDQWARTDTGGPTGYYNTPGVVFPKQTNQFAIAETPAWQYNYGTYVLPTPSGGGGGGMPGQILSVAAGNKYNCMVFPSGIGSQGTKVVGTCLQLAAGETIPQGTWAIFAVVPGVGGSEYYFQIPIWLG